MVRIYIIGLLVFLQGSFIAQINADSLWRVWKDINQSDSARLKALHSLAADVYIFSDPDSSVVLSKLEYNFAEKKQLKKYMAYALNTQAVSYIYRGQSEKAIEYFNKSLKLRKEINDQSGIASSYKNISSLYRNIGDFDQAIEYSLKSLQLYEKLNNKKGIASVLNNLSTIYLDKADFQTSIDYLKRALKISEQLGEKETIAVSYNNLGIILNTQGDAAKAIDYYMKSLKLYEEIGQLKGQADLLLNIGVLYMGQGITEKAIEYCQKSLSIARKIENNHSIASCLNNLGAIYHTYADKAMESGNKANARDLYLKAKEHFVQSSKIHTATSDLLGLSTSINNIGLIEQSLGNLQSAVKYFNESLSLREKLNDKAGIAKSYICIGGFHAANQNHSVAISYYSKALALAKELGVANEIRESAYLLYKSYKLTGNKDLALSMYELASEMRDSIEKMDYKKEIFRQEFKFIYDKKAEADSIRSNQAKVLAAAKITAQNAQLEKRQTQLYYLIFGAGILLTFVFVMYNRFKITQRQKLIIEKQKHLVVEQNKEILDSINYAKRIQAAILPPAKLIKEAFNESFIYYLPKDIVAGDFYWMEKKNNKLLIAVADCTGHGVPGAMVSVICNNGLNRSVREHGLTDPGKILDKTREIVISEFEKSEEDVQDGMDISLCSITLSELKLEWAGANNPLWLIRKGQLLEFKGDKQPIGKYSNSKPFITHQIQLLQNDVIYIFSDGFADQFGGPDSYRGGKKFKASSLKELLLSIQAESMEEQKTMISQAFEKWKGNFPQIDDVCMIGIKV